MSESVTEVFELAADVVEVTVPTDVATVVEPHVEKQVVEVVDVAESVPAAEVVVPGAPGPRGLAGDEITGIAAEPITRLQAVWMDPTGQLHVASSLDAAHIRFVVGLAAHNALAGDELTVVQSGPMPAGDTPFPIGCLFLGVDGSITLDWSTGLVQLHVACGLTAEVINVRLEPALYRGGTP